MFCPPGYRAKSAPGYRAAAEEVLAPTDRCAIRQDAISVNTFSNPKRNPAQIVRALDSDGKITPAEVKVSTLKLEFRKSQGNPRALNPGVFKIFRFGQKRKSNRPKRVIGVLIYKEGRRASDGVDAVRGNKQ